MEIYICKTIKDLLVTMNIEKAFDSSDHACNISIMKKLDLKKIILSGLQFC